MTTYNIGSWSKVITPIKGALDDAKRLSTKEAAELFVKLAKQGAPKPGKYATGDTLRGIRKRKSKDGWSVESWVPGEFKQNFWVNQTGDYLSVRMRWNKFQPTVYGDGSHEARGTPGFFNNAQSQVRRKYLKIASRNTSKSLRSRLG